MSLLAVLLLLSGTARIETMNLTRIGQSLAVRLRVVGTPGKVAVSRDGAVARVSIAGASLGGPFAGGRQFSWIPTQALATATGADTSLKLDRLEISATDSAVSVLLYVPPGVSVDARRDRRGLLLVLRRGPPTDAVADRAAQAAQPGTRARPTLSETTLPTPDTAELAKRLFPAPSSEASSEASSGASVAELYPRLFPAGIPEPPPDAAEVDIPEVGEEAGAALGPLRVRMGVDVRYLDADTFVAESAVPTRDNYLEVQPRVHTAAPVGAGAFDLEYAPVFRGLADYQQVNANSHLLAASLELPVGALTRLRVGDRFWSGVLDTRVVDPGGEYFFGLGRFHRNDLDARASLVVGPRLSLELQGSLGRVRFVEESSFFDYDTRAASAGLGFELRPSLRMVASYVYDSVPLPAERPQAASSAHNARLALDGEILPLLSGQLALGYRRQDSPNAGPEGQRYSGLTLQASLLRELGRDASFALYLNRSTPVSAFEDDGFYVSTGVQGVLELPLPARLEARGGLGYQWNDYRTIAQDIGVPREDRILGWFVGLRRPIAGSVSLSGAYRREDRRSNLDSFATDAEGVYLQLEWDILGRTPR